MWKKVNLGEKKSGGVGRPTPPDFFEIWRKSQSGGAVHKSGLAKLIR